METKFVPTGELLFKPGLMDDSIYVVKNGCLKVFILEPVGGTWGVACGICVYRRSRFVHCVCVVCVHACMCVCMYIFMYLCMYMV